MKKNVIIALCAVLLALMPSPRVWAATDDELFSMMMDARGAIYTGNFEDGLSFCNQALEANPDFAEAYSARSEAKFYLKDVDGALADAKKAIEMTPDDSSIDQAYYVRSMIALDYAAELDNALAFISKAIDLTKYEPMAEYYELRAEIYEKLGRSDEAQADLAKADELYANQ